MSPHSYREIGAQPSIRLLMRESTPRVVVGGELDHRAVGQLSDYLDGIARRFAERIELDLSAVRRIDPAGVKFLVRARRRFGDGRILIVPSEAIARTVHFVAQGERNRREGGGSA
jgi:anti-anti-sigma regulatory factor